MRPRVSVRPRGFTFPRCLARTIIRSRGMSKMPGGLDEMTVNDYTREGQFSGWLFTRSTSLLS